MNTRVRDLVLKTAILCSFSSAGYNASAWTDTQSSLAYARSVHQTTQSAILRSGMSRSRTSVANIPQNQAITVLEADQDGVWARIKGKGHTGYLCTMDQKPAQAGEKPAKSVTKGQSLQADCYLMYNTQGVTLRKDPAVDSAPLARLKAGSDLLLIDKKDSWYKVCYRNQSGWVPRKNLPDHGEDQSMRLSSQKKDPAPKSAAAKASRLSVSSRNESGHSAGSPLLTTGGVNLRSGASKDSRRLDTLAKGTKVFPLQQAGSWYKVSYHGGSGWLYRDYVDDQGSPRGSVSSLTSSGKSSLGSAVKSKIQNGALAKRSERVIITTQSSYGNRSIPLKGQIIGTSLSRVDVYLNGTFLNQAKLYVTSQIIEINNGRLSIA